MNPASGYRLPSWNFVTIEVARSRFSLHGEGIKVFAQIILDIELDNNTICSTLTNLD